jgi:hypothetical protein
MRSILSASSESESLVRGFAPEARRSARAVLEPGRADAVVVAGVEEDISVDVDASPAVVDGVLLFDDGAGFLGECLRGRGW